MTPDTLTEKNECLYAYKNSSCIAEIYGFGNTLNKCTSFPGDTMQRSQSRSSAELYVVVRRQIRLIGRVAGKWLSG